jgi:methylmalonyl-CoA mutase C-terminal domain/subunit
VEQKRPIKVLVAKPGLDGHDRGANVVAMGLRDEGMEVIYSGLRQTPEKIVQTAVQEDVDVIGLSILSGAHNRLFPEIIKLLKEKGKEDTLVVAGGHILEKDIPFLQEVGISAVFGHGVSVKSIAEYIRNNVSF